MGTLSLNLKELEKEELIQRRVGDTKPIQSFCGLTEKGASMAEQLTKIQRKAKS
ncbi:MAG: winged helix-turn-helix transcriptional regulator [Candidatus Bathyarchaeia archaeon]